MAESAAHWWIESEHVLHGREIGRGSFGIVRAAEWRHTPVAVKILYQDAQAEDRELFQKEVNMMATLHHPNIVQFFGYTRSPELTLIIEYFPEGSMEDYVKQQKPGAKLSLSFCTDMALAIEYLHSRKPSIVIHRDIKPANFLLTGSHRVKLGDFGIARARRFADPTLPPSASNCSLEALDRSLNGNERLSTPFDEFTSNCGTVRFMAPEIAATDGSKTRKYSTKADVYSLSLVYYFIWERILPNIERHNTPALHLEALLAGKRPVFSRTPKPMRELISNMWQLEPNDRVSAESVLDFINRLKCKPSLNSASCLVLAKDDKVGGSRPLSADKAAARRSRTSFDLQ